VCSNRNKKKNEWKTYLYRTVSLLQQESNIKQMTKTAVDIKQRAFARAHAKAKTHDPIKVGADIPVEAPDLVFDEPGYKATEIGQVQPNHEYPETEGYRPPNGYFEQSEDCDQVMRMWFDDCAFLDAPGSIYHLTPDAIFPAGGPVGDVMPTAKYIGNLLKKVSADEPRAKSKKTNRG